MRNSKKKKKKAQRAFVQSVLHVFVEFCGSLLLSVDKWRGWCMVGRRSGKSAQRYQMVALYCHPDALYSA